MIRIMLVDDHSLVREGVSRLLGMQPDMQVVGSFAEGAPAVAFAAKEEPDVAIVDVAMPQASGIDV
ncbi:MAG: response regulator transcription factor, partial [Betaproteobacteria bacterium]